MTKLGIIVLALALPGCQAHIQITDGDIECVVDSSRRTAMTCGSATVVTGQVLINDETVQVLGKAYVPVITPDGEK